MAHTSSPLDTLPLNIITRPIDEIAVEHDIRIVRLEENFRHFLTILRRSRATQATQASQASKQQHPPKPQTYECGTQTDAPPPKDYKVITATHTGEIALIKHDIETLQREYTALYNFTVSISEALNKKHS